ncbi:uncharacterized protein [Cherax quadricarinatus]
MERHAEATAASTSHVQVGGAGSQAPTKHQVSDENEECNRSKLTLTEALISDINLPSDLRINRSEGSCENGEVVMNGVVEDGNPILTSPLLCRNQGGSSPHPPPHANHDKSDDEANFEVSELINEILHQSSYLEEGALNGLEFVGSLPQSLQDGEVEVAITGTSRVLPLYLDRVEGRSSSPDSDSNMRTASEGSSTPTSQLSVPSAHSSDHQHDSTLESMAVTNQTDSAHSESNSENALQDDSSASSESKSKDPEVIVDVLSVSECLSSLTVENTPEVLRNLSISDVGLLDDIALQNTKENGGLSVSEILDDSESKSVNSRSEIKSEEEESDSKSEDNLLTVEPINTTLAENNHLQLVDVMNEVPTLETMVNDSCDVTEVLSSSPAGDITDVESEEKVPERDGSVCETTLALETLSLHSVNFENSPESSLIALSNLTVNSISDPCKQEEKLDSKTEPDNSSPCHEDSKAVRSTCGAETIEEDLQTVPDKDMDRNARANNDCLCKRMQAVEEGGGVMVGVWAELRSSLRQLHRSMIPQSTQGSAHRSRPSLNRIKALANMLVTHDAHQLYMRISHLAHELCIELKVRLLAIIHDNPTPEEATTFIQGVCDSYQWVMGVCEALHPALERLDSEHLNRFKLNWVTVNMHIFHSTILTDPDVQDYAQICKQKLNGSTGGDDVIGCLASLHRTLGVAEAVWVRADVLLQDYTVERAAVSTRRRQLLADWEQFKAQQRTQHHQELAMKNGIQNAAVTSVAEESAAQCPCDDCAVGRGKMNDSQPSSTSSRIPLSSSTDIRPPSSCECHFCNASLAAATTEEPVLPPSSGSSLPPLAQPQLSLYPHIHNTPPGSDIVGVGQSREELGPIPPAPTTKPPITTNPYVGSDLLTEQLMREWEMVYGDTLTPPGSHPILPPPEAVLQTYETDPSSLVSGVETLRISSSRPSYTRTMVDPSLPYVPDSHATARAHTTILPSSRPTSSTASHPVSSTSCHASKVPVSSRNSTPCTDGGCSSAPQVSSLGGNKCCSVTNTTSVITHTRAHHTCTTASTQKGECRNGLEDTQQHQVERSDRSTSRESVGESETSGGDEWSSGDESDSSTTVSSTHQDPHCDCCYCHMLHHKQGGGRQKYSDRRDRLLQILSRKKKARSCSAVSCSASTVSTNTHTPTPAAVPTPATPGVPTTKGGSTPLGGQNIDKILDFIEGNHMDEAKHAKKAAKKARQRQKKMAIRREEEEDEGDEEEDFDEKEDDGDDVEEDGPLAELRRRAPDVTITVVRPGQQTSRTPATPQVASQRPREPSPSSMDKGKPLSAKLVPSLAQSSTESPSQPHSTSRTILHPYRQSSQQSHQLSQSSRQASVPTPPLAAKPTSFNNKETVTNPPPLSGPSSLSNILKGMDTTTKEKDKGSQMVTIRRVMDPNNSEPTVTITLKGDQPEKDKVLFKLVNGQVSGNGGHSGQGIKKGGNRLQSQPQFQPQSRLPAQPQPVPNEPKVPEGLDPEEVKKFKKRQKKERQRLRKQQEQMQEQQKGQLQQLELQKQQEILRQQQEHIHQQQLALQRQQEELLRQQQQQQNNPSNNTKKSKRKNKGGNAPNPSNTKSGSNKIGSNNSAVSAVVYDGDDMAQSFNLPPGVTINKVEGQPGMVTISNNMGGAFSQPFLPNPNVYPNPIVQGFSTTQENSISKPYGRSHAPGLSWNSAVDGSGNYPDKDNVIVVDTNNSFLGASPVPSSSSSKREISSDERVMMAVKGLIDPSTLNMTQKKKFKKKKKELQEEKEREEQKQREEDELMDQMYNIATGKWAKQPDVVQRQLQGTKNQSKKNQKPKENCKQPVVQSNCIKQSCPQATKNNKLTQKTQEIQQQKPKQQPDVVRQLNKSNKQNSKETMLQNITNQSVKNANSCTQNGKVKQQQQLQQQQIQQQAQTRQLAQQKQQMHDKQQFQLKQQKQLQQPKQTLQQQKQNHQQQQQPPQQQPLKLSQQHQQQKLSQHQPKQNQQQQRQQKQQQQPGPLQQKQQQQQNFHQPYQQQARQMHESQNVNKNHKLNNSFGNFAGKVGYVPQDIAHEARYAQYLAANANTLAKMSYNTFNGNVLGEHIHDQCVGGDDDKKNLSKKKKNKKGKKGHLEDMTTIDSVFTPKDVAEGELDETERDVEAFKRFCFNNVPRYSGEKPKVNFNVKDIMIKKRPCNVNL